MMVISRPGRYRRPRLPRDMAELTGLPNDDRQQAHALPAAGRMIGARAAGTGTKPSTRHHPTSQAPAAASVPMPQFATVRYTEQSFGSARRRHRADEWPAPNDGSASVLPDSPRHSA